ncbi:2-succinyl-6-hydroxy-2,4-cyclohexadiene-1-carboxylate synthase [Kineosporia sp. NBRC 101677]|uniref:alpha/beta fold hydrolase n=1 Tax=Kineosporia sp. NBRC 101677 TaxID=3032197 RepID=UPI0024A0D9CB|nr:alpha/beta hydrolase [Kineosporia sp. NBRC 101677]GLY17011.1 2-succinyl-6-hydroxy-2,4-cyclohexadiene-1-carboxylate synthase [Kineosporia sp. NBRC 101677]
METREITVGGRTFSYTDSAPSRPSTAPTLVLGHGYFLDRTMFSAVFESSLAHSWRIIAWDARGHGNSPEGESPFDYWDQARDVLGLLDALKVPQAVVGGVSQGGFTALRVALLAPQRVRGLVLLDTEAQACDPHDKVVYAGMFAGLAEHGPVEGIVVPLSRQLIGEHPAAHAWIRNWQRHYSLPLGAAAQCLLERDDVSGRLGEITCPALLVRGSEDQSLPRSRMQLMSEAMPGAGEVHEIPGAGHSPTITHPQQVLTLLESFLPRTV